MNASAAAYDRAPEVSVCTNRSWNSATCVLSAWYSRAWVPKNAAIALETSSAPAASTTEVEPAATAFAALTEAPIRARSAAAASAICGAIRTKDIATSQQPIAVQYRRRDPDQGKYRSQRPEDK